MLMGLWSLVCRELCFLGIKVIHVLLLPLGSLSSWKKFDESYDVNSNHVLHFFYEFDVETIISWSHGWATTPLICLCFLSRYTLFKLQNLFFTKNSNLKYDKSNLIMFPPLHNYLKHEMRNLSSNYQDAISEICSSPYCYKVLEVPYTSVTLFNKLASWNNFYSLSFLPIHNHCCASKAFNPANLMSLSC